MGMAALMLKLPTGAAPDWETKALDDDLLLNSTPLSLAVHHSLRQSRNSWLTSVFPKFSSKAKGKVQAEQPPAHDLKFIAKADVEIGPHVFHDTSFYEAHYLPEPSQYAVGVSSSATQAQNSYSSSYRSTAPSTTAPGSFSTARTLDASVEVTPALIAQVNAAASSNPMLQNLLQSAAMGRASIEQLQTLGILIQTLATQHRISQQASSTDFLGTQSSTSQPSGSPPQPTVKRHDFVIEFRENHTDRFIIPHEIVACQQDFPSGTLAGRDIVLSTFAPFNQDKDDTQPQSKTTVVIRLKRATNVLWESVWGWVNEDAKKPDALTIFCEKARSSKERIYLQHRLPEGDLLANLRTASTIHCRASSNGHTMKSIKPSSPAQSAKPKRSRPRKSQTPKVAKSSDVNTAVSNSEPQASPVAAADAVATTSMTLPVPKRRKLAPKNMLLDSLSRTPIQFINTMAPPPPPARQQPSPATPTSSLGVTSYGRFAQGFAPKVSSSVKAPNEQPPRA
ncbi:hypothetical protein EW145_g1895 [Phellinidium pouzarii]|uniref:Uncharacterized protein n=1 Tax=Phellinidium pouzarii TaxID=167371 RepID=A0A4S4LCV9_9AGAM|nr:hypothetical protein EW145_g1895 [Phellinidium pouzarii]